MSLCFTLDLECSFELYLLVFPTDRIVVNTTEWSQCTNSIPSRWNQTERRTPGTHPKHSNFQWSFSLLTRLEL